MVDTQVMTATPAYDVASHGNFHVFSYKDSFYLYDIAQMNAYEIDEGLYLKLITNRNGSDFFENFIKSLPAKNIKVRLTDVNYPIHNLVLMVAQVCNLSCVYCYGVDGEYGTKGKMNEEVAYKSVDFLIKQSGDVQTISITFFGGEPLLNFPIIKKVVDYSRKKAKEAKKTVSFSITTNGTKFNDEINAYLNQNNFGVLVSFDGDEEIQNSNRPYKNGKGSYANTLPKIQAFLKSRNGNATARATITNFSHDLDDLKKRLINLGFRRAHATPATVSEFALDKRGIEKVSDFQYDTLLTNIEKEADEILDAIVNRKDLSGFIGNPIVINITQLINKTKSMNPCGAGRAMLGVSITGDLYPCHRFVGNEKFNLGNLDSFDKASKETYVNNYTENHPVCSKCWAKYHCGGRGCIHDNEVTMGDVNNVNIKHCTILKYGLKNSIHIYNSLNEQDREYFNANIK